jgi:hypothetical protein
MTPDARWLAAGALAITVMWLASSPVHDAEVARWIGAFSLTETDDETPLAPDAASDLEARWIGHPVVVRHIPDEPPTRLFARLGADGRWTCTGSDMLDGSTSERAGH